MRRPYCAGRSGGWESHQEEFWKDGKFSVWASTKVRECYDEVEAEDEGRLSIAQDILRKSTEFRKENYGAEWWCRECYPPERVPSLSLPLLGMGRNRAAGGVRHVAASMIGGLRTEY